MRINTSAQIKTHENKKTESESENLKNSKKCKEPDMNLKDQLFYKNFVEKNKPLLKKVYITLLENFYVSLDQLNNYKTEALCREALFDILWDFKGFTAKLISYFIKKTENNLLTNFLIKEDLKYQWPLNFADKIKLNNLSKENGLPNNFVQQKAEKLVNETEIIIKCILNDKTLDKNNSDDDYYFNKMYTTIFNTLFENFKNFENIKVSKDVKQCLEFKNIYFKEIRYNDTSEELTNTVGNSIGSFSNNTLEITPISNNSIKLSMNNDVESLSNTNMYVCLGAVLGGFFTLILILFAFFRKKFRKLRGFF